MRKIVLCVLALAAATVPAPGAADTRLRMSTTTSTDNSGLLDVLLPPFEKANGVKVDVIAVGTGKALKLGENGDVDLVLVHARGAEEEFVAAGHGVNRRDVMHNDFVILGPSSDPAGLRGAASAADAFGRLAGAEADFVSRGDDSGTHKKERAIWKESGIDPSGAWCAQAGQGMGAVLRIADEKGAYTLSDRGTWIAHAGRLDLEIVFQGDPVLHNPYGIIAVNPALHPHVDYEMAMRLIAFVTGREGQRIIDRFRVGGSRLFHPDAVPNP